MNLNNLFHYSNILDKDPSLVGWWKLTEGRGTTAVDSSKYNGSVSISGGPSVVKGERFPYSLNFNNSSSQFITLPSFTTGTANTFSAWVYPRTKNDISTIMANCIDGGNPLGFSIFINSYLTNNQTVNFQVGSGTSNTGVYSASGIIKYNVWQMITATYVNQVFRLYLNGRLLGTTTNAINWTKTDNIRLGGFTNSSFPLNANINDVRIYNRALSPNEVLSLYNNRLYKTNTKNWIKEFVFSETLNFTITSTTTLSDIQSYIEHLNMTLLTATSIVDLQNYIDSLSFLITSITTISDLQTYAETLNFVISSVTTEQDYQTYAEALSFIIQSQTTISELVSFVENLNFTITSTTSINDLYSAYENLNVLISSQTSITDKQAYIDNLNLILVTVIEILEVYDFILTDFKPISLKRKRLQQFKLKRNRLTKVRAEVQEPIKISLRRKNW